MLTQCESRHLVKTLSAKFSPLREMCFSQRTEILIHSRCNRFVLFELAKLVDFGNSGLTAMTAIWLTKIMIKPYFNLLFPSPKRSRRSPQNEIFTKSPAVFSRPVFEDQQTNDPRPEDQRLDNPRPEDQRPNDPRPEDQRPEGGWSPRGEKPGGWSPRSEKP